MANEKTEPTFTVNLEQLAQVVAQAVTQAMQGQGAPAPFSLDGLGDIIGSAVAEGLNKTQRRKVTFGEYQLKGHSPFHPKTKAETPVLTRRCWQNGVWMNPTTLYDKEIELLNQITHSGRYINRLVEVVIRDDNADEEVYIRFNNQTPDQQMELKGYARNFIDMLQQIIAAQTEERAEKEEQEQKKSKRFKAADFDAARAVGKKPWEANA